MLESVIATAVSVALFFPLPGGATTNSSTQNAPVLTVVQKSLLFRVCVHAAADEMERCRAKQLARMGYESTGDYAGNYVETVEGQQQGDNYVRAALRAKRVQETAQYHRQTRKTYRQSPTQGQSNDHQRRSYLNDIREERLACMLKTTGRTRALCLEELARTSRRIMRALSDPSGV